MNEIKFSVFADLHYRPGVFFTEGEKRLESIIARAESSGAEFIVHLGDLCHAPHENAALIARFESAPMPAYHCLGNHGSSAGITSSTAAASASSCSTSTAPAWTESRCITAWATA